MTAGMVAERPAASKVEERHIKAAYWKIYQRLVPVLRIADQQQRRLLDALGVAEDIVLHGYGALGADGSYTVTRIGQRRFTKKLGGRWIARGTFVVDKHRRCRITVTVQGRCDCGCGSGPEPCAARLAREIAVLAQSIQHSEPGVVQAVANDHLPF